MARVRRGMALFGGIAALVLAAWAPPASADWNGDAKGDVLAIDSAGGLLMYRGDGAGPFMPGNQQVGSGWGSFTALLAPGDFSGDGNADVLARQSDGALLMYRGNGAGGWVTGRGEQIGSGWQGFTALAAGGDFSGDGNPDVLARQSDGAFLMYRSNGAGGFLPGNATIGSGWQSLTFLT